MEYLQKEDALARLRTDEKGLCNLLRTFTRELSVELLTMESALYEKKVEQFRICVHGIKSASNNIGVLELSMYSALLEEYAKQREIEKIKDHFIAYKMIALKVLHECEQYCESQIQSSDEKMLLETFDSDLISKLKKGAVEMDYLMLQEVLEKLSAYRYPEQLQLTLDEISTAVEEMEYEQILELLHQIPG